MAAAWALVLVLLVVTVKSASLTDCPRVSFYRPSCNQFKNDDVFCTVDTFGEGSTCAMAYCALLHNVFDDVEGLNFTHLETGDQYTVAQFLHVVGQGYVNKQCARAVAFISNNRSRVSHIVEQYLSNLQETTVPKPRKQLDFVSRNYTFVPLDQLYPRVFAVLIYTIDLFCMRHPHVVYYRCANGFILLTMICLWLLKRRRIVIRDLARARINQAMERCVDTVPVTSAVREVTSLSAADKTVMQMNLSTASSFPCFKHIAIGAIFAFHPFMWMLFVVQLVYRVVWWLIRLGHVTVVATGSLMSWFVPATVSLNDMPIAQLRDYLDRPEGPPDWLADQIGSSLARRGGIGSLDENKAKICSNFLRFGHADGPRVKIFHKKNAARDAEDVDTPPEVEAAIRAAVDDSTTTTTTTVQHEGKGKGSNKRRIRVTLTNFGRQHRRRGYNVSGGTNEKEESSPLDYDPYYDVPEEYRHDTARIAEYDAYLAKECEHVDTFAELMSEDSHDWTADDQGPPRLRIDFVEAGQRLAEKKRSFWDRVPVKHESLVGAGVSPVPMPETVKLQRDLSALQRSVSELTELVQRKFADLHRSPEGVPTKRDEPLQQDTTPPIKHEALHAETPVFQKFKQCIVLDKTGKSIGSATCVANGILMNEHVLKEADRIRVFKAQYVLPEKMDVQVVGEDLVWLPITIGAARKISIKQFALPTANVAVGMYDHIARHFSKGSIISVEEPYCRYGISSVPGACGSLVVTGAGKIVGFHTADQRFCPVTNKLLKFFRDPKPSITVLSPTLTTTTTNTVETEHESKSSVVPTFNNVKVVCWSRGGTVAKK